MLKIRKKLGDLKSKSLLSYILSFSIIVVLIILVMGTYLYQFYYGTIYNDFINGNKNYLSAISNRHENDLAGINNIMIQMGFTDNNVEFKLDESPIKSLGLEKQLYRYVSVSEFFSQIFFYYREDKYLYNHATSIDIQRFLEEGLVLGDTPAEEFYDILHSTEGGMQVLKEQKVDGYLSKRFSNISAEAVIYLMQLEPKKSSMLAFVVGDSYYDKILDNKAEELRKNLILYKEQVIVSRGSLDIDTTTLLERISNTDKTQFQTVIDGKKYLVTLDHGEQGLIYCTVQSVKIFKNKIVTEQWGILFLLLICSIPTSLVIVMLSKKLSKKVRGINALLSDDEEHYYDLEHLEYGIRALVQDNKVASKESLPLRRTRFIRAFVRGEYVSREAVVKDGELLNLRTDSQYYGIALMRGRGNSNENKAHSMMLDMIEYQKHVDGFGVHLINKDQSLFVIFGDAIQDMKVLFDEFLTIGISHCEDFTMSASGFHQDFTEASKAYLEADTAFDNRFLVDNSSVIYFSDVAMKEQVELLPDAYIQRLKNSIRASDEVEAKKVIEGICNRLKAKGQSLLTFRLLCNEIIHMMIAEWNGTNTDFENIYSVFALSECLTIKDFNDILWDVCSKLLDNKEVVDIEQSDMVTNAIDYMKSNYYSPDLNMSFLAEQLNISGVTLAVEFKNVMGMSPSDYLAIIRVENAKVLLKETQLLVKEISIAVGYEDSNVFTRRFKKYVGKTPGQYRIDN